MTGILAIVAALIPLLIWLIKRRAAQADDPLQQHRDRCQQADSDIADGDGVQAGEHGAADLDELERLQRAKSNQRGPDAGPNAGGPEVPGAV